jgi:hypothetical protein
MKTGQTAGCQTTGKSRHFRSFIFTRQYVLIFISTRSYFLRVSWLKLLRHPLRGNIAQRTRSYTRVYRDRGELGQKAGMCNNLKQFETL